MCAGSSIRAVFRHADSEFQLGRRGMRVTVNFTTGDCRMDINPRPGVPRWRTTTNLTSGRKPVYGPDEHLESPGRKDRRGIELSAVFANSQLNRSGNQEGKGMLERELTVPTHGHRSSAWFVVQ